ncbi:MAG: hypothetical protein IK093_12045, partial [Ruminiclostridium sp.]|nr:hypothetical protein [Ruminiclostridium sp.]
MDISSRRKLSKAMAALVFASAVTGAAFGNVKASAYEGNTEEGVDQDQDLGTSVKSLLGEAANYNVFIKENYTQNGFNNVDAGDGNANLAVGGNFNVGAGCSQACSSATVGGSVTGTIIGNYINGGIDFDSAFTSLKETSNALAQLSGGTIEDGSIYNDYGRIKFVGTNTGVNVFNITVDEWNALKGATAGRDEGHNCAIDYVVPEGSAVIVNITGADAVDLVFNWGSYYASGTPLTSGNTEANSKVLINIPGGNNVVIDAGIGCVLAPESNVSSGANYGGGSAHYEGQLIANSFTGNIEFGSSKFDGENPDVTDLITPTDDVEDEEDKEENEETTDEDETPGEDDPSVPEGDDDSDETEYTSEVTIDADTPIDYVSSTENNEVVTEPGDETPSDDDTTNPPDAPLDAPNLGSGRHTDETPDDETPADETPADETPADETPADETPADETPADETPADETPADETPADETPADETPADETPADETPADETPADETP